MPLHASRPPLSLPTTLSLARRLVPLVFSLVVGVGSAQAAPLAAFSPSSATAGPWTGQDALQGEGGAARWAGQVLGGVVRRQVEEGGGGGEGEMSHKEFLFKLIFSIVFVLLGGVFSGLSLGLMGLDSTNLQVLAFSGPPSDRRDAQRVLQLLSHGRHFVLCTLLLSNVVVNETLPVFLDSLTGGGGLLAVVISSALIVIFGEVLPQALCAQHGLRVGAKCVGFVRVLMYLSSPLCYPTAKLLDLLLGAHDASVPSNLYRRAELKTLLALHAAPSAHSAGHGGEYEAVEGAEGEGARERGLSETEVEMLGQVLGLAERTAEDAVRATGGEGCYVVCDGMRVCDVDLKRVLLDMRRYIPVKRSRSFSSGKEGREESFVGFITVEQIVNALCCPNDLIRTLPLSPLVQVLGTTPLIECFAYLKHENPSAVLLVSPAESNDKPAPPLGFLSLDDLAKLLVLPAPSPASSPYPPADARTSLSRASLAGATRPRSSSIGLERFVQGIVDRQLAHSSRGRNGGKGHRASSSQLSFRLSTSSDESSSDADSPSVRRVGHSHHRSTSSAQFRPSSPASSSASYGFHPLASPSTPPSYHSSPRMAFRFPPSSSSITTGAGSSTHPSPLFDDVDRFSIGTGVEDGESEYGEGEEAERSGRGRGGEGDDSGFAVGGEEGEVSFAAAQGTEDRRGWKKGGADPLGAVAG
ncbi:hypothetical protein JCM8097_005100 [Rhodosporidiobolus ruineniae]